MFAISWVKHELVNAIATTLSNHSGINFGC
jgi:hypothetical protein